MKSPVLFIIYNRPDKTKTVFETIRQYKPHKLYIAADGPNPKRLNDQEKTIATREVVMKIDWQCKVKTLFRKKNLGCKKAVSGAISWFFDDVESGIILEDDCLPDITFFDFCTQLLRKYKNNKRIMHISGDNFQRGIKRGKGDYYFSKYPHIWGWASWRSAWENYDPDMKSWPKNKNNKYFFKNKLEKIYWSDTFELAYKNNIDTWDYQWIYSIWRKRGLCIIPNTNLVTNIGFDEESTHTSKKNKYLKIPAGHLTKPLLHPKKIKICDEADLYTSKHAFKINPGHIVIKKIFNIYKFIVTPFFYKLP